MYITCAYRNETAGHDAWAISTHSPSLKHWVRGIRAKRATTSSCSILKKTLATHRISRMLFLTSDRRGIWQCRRMIVICLLFQRLAHHYCHHPTPRGTRHPAVASVHYHRAQWTTRHRPSFHEHPAVRRKRKGLLGCQIPTGP